MVFELRTRRISANSAFADDSWGKCPSCSAVTSSPCKSEGSDGQGYSDNPGQCPRLEKRSDLLLSQAAENHQGRGRDLSLVAEFPDREPVVLTGILVYTRSRGLVSRGIKNLVPLSICKTSEYFGLHRRVRLLRTTPVNTLPVWASLRRVRERDLHSLLNIWISVGNTDAGRPVDLVLRSEGSMSS